MARPGPKTHGCSASWSLSTRSECADDGLPSWLCSDLSFFILPFSGDGEIDLKEFQEFNRKYPMLLFPAFYVQNILRCKVLGTI